MTIRDLNNDGNRLSIFADEQGDIYVTVLHDGETYRESCVYGVRIGGPCSGHSIPPKIKQLLYQLAEEFEKYKDCKFEVDAFRKYMEGE